jgi:hypothetical protein
LPPVKHIYHKPRKHERGRNAQTAEVVERRSKGGGKGGKRERESRIDVECTPNAERNAVHMNIKQTQNDEEQNKTKHHCSCER